MDEIRFSIHGQTKRLTRAMVIDSTKGLTPETIQRWGVFVDERLFPVKQVFGAAIGESRENFISNYARNKLGKLGFQVVNVESGEVVDRSGKTANVNEEADGRQHQIRISSLQIAVQYLVHKGGADLTEVLTAAEALEKWISR